MQPNRHILSTRPLAAPTVAEAALNGLFIEERSFIKTEPVQEFVLPPLQHQVIVFTSMNAVEAVATKVKTQPAWLIYCVGTATAKNVAELLPGSTILFIANDAKSLAEVIISNNEKEVTFFCGDMRRDELPALLQQNSITVHEVVVYKTILQPVPVEKDYDAILFFSPSAVQSFFSLNKVNKTAILFAIGSTTAGEIRKYCTNTIITAEEPGKNELVKLAINHFSQISQTD